ncbi:MAG: ABC transporter permease, partial [Bacteroidetes bacterium]|nr:ABC transporter permease [Bacteroidota bacterium]
NQLVTQLLGESFIMTFVSMAIAIILVILVLPVINNLTGKEMEAGLLLTPSILTLLLGILFVVGLLSGLYPAIFMSGFRPVDILKGSFSTSAKGNLLRKSLVVFQFATSIALIASTMIVYQQLNFMFNTDLGFTKEQVIILPTHTDRGIGEKFALLKEELEKLPEVSHTSISDNVPGYFMNNNVVRKGWTEEAEWSDMRFLRIDEDFFDLYGVKVIAGRGFEEKYGTDEGEAFLLNESGMKRLGWNNPEEAIGQKLAWQRRQGFVIGIIEDFHFMSVKNPIEPVIYIPSSNHRGFLSVRTSSDDYHRLLQTIEREYEKILPGKAFEYKFLDEDFDRQYKNEERFGQLFIYFTSLAVLIACMGLFGLAALAGERRRKEMGIRKVLGASVRDIVFLLSRNFMILVGVAFIVAVPLTWFTMDNWLEDFAVRIQLGPTSFLLAGILAGVIAMGTISFHILKTARSNPAETLRSE